MRFFQKTVLSSILGVGARETAAISFLGLLTTSLDPPHNPISSSTDSSKGSLLALEFASASVNRLNMLKKKKIKLMGRLVVVKVQWFHCSRRGRTVVLTG